MDFGRRGCILDKGFGYYGCDVCMTRFFVNSSQTLLSPVGGAAGYETSQSTGPIPVPDVVYRLENGKTLVLASTAGKKLVANILSMM